MECLRCGVCCSKHQALVGPQEAQRIAAYLNITPDEWQKTYSEPKWHSDNNYLIRHDDGACIFLKFADDISYCAIQKVKPQCCIDWMPGADKKECLEGLGKRRTDAAYSDTTS